MRLKWCSHKGQSAHWELHRLSRKPFWQVQSQPRLAFPNQWVRAIWRSVGEKGWTRVVQRSVGEYRVPGKYVAVCVCVNTPRNTGKWFLIGTFSGQCHKSKPSDGADFEVFRSSLFCFFQLRHVRFANFTLTTLPIFNISISDKFQAGGSGSHFQARANEDLGSVDVQTYLQFSDMACG